MTERDDFPPENLEPAPDPPPTGRVEDTPPRPWSASAGSEQHQQSTPHSPPGYPTSPPEPRASRGMGYNEDTRMFSVARSDQAPWERGAGPPDPGASWPRSPEPYARGARPPESPAQEPRAPEPPAQEPRAPEPRAPEPRATDPRASEPRGPERSSEPRAPERGSEPWRPPRQGPPPSAAEAGWANYVESFRTSELVPTRRVPPARGWRLAVYKATFGLINPGQSPDELRQAELEGKVRTLLRGNYKIGVLGKGGVGKTSVAVSVGSILADHRQDDRVVAIDADTAFGKLGSRVDPHAGGSFWDLAADEHLDSFADVRTRVGNNSAGLFVLAGESATLRRRVLDPAVYREATSRLDRHFTISIVDCGSTIDAPVTQEVLRDLDAMIVVSSPWVDGASAAGQTLEYLHNRGLNGLLHRTVIVLNDSDGHANKRTRSILAQQFASRGQPVFEVPFDAHLRPGGVIDVVHEMSPKTRRKFLEITAAVAENFAATADRPRDPRGR